MRTTINRAGRIVIPAAIRDAAGLVAGSEVEVRLRGRSSRARDRRDAKRGRLTVATAGAAQERLSEETVRETTMDALRLGS